MISYDCEAGDVCLTFDLIPDFKHKLKFAFNCMHVYFSIFQVIMAIALEQLQCFDMSQTLYPNVSFTEVERTDFYRKAKPYRLLMNPGKSSVTMTFGLSGADNISKVRITE